MNPISVFRGPDRYESAGQGPVSAFAQRNPILALGSTTTGAAGFGGLFDGSTVLGVQLNLAPLIRWM